MGVLRETGGIQIVEYSLFLFYDGTLPRKFPASCRNGFRPHTLFHMDGILRDCLTRFTVIFSINVFLRSLRQPGLSPLDFPPFPAIQYINMQGPSTSSGLRRRISFRQVYILSSLTKCSWQPHEVSADLHTRVIQPPHAGCTTHVRKLYHSGTQVREAVNKKLKPCNYAQKMRIFNFETSIFT